WQLLHSGRIKHDLMSQAEKDEVARSLLIQWKREGFVRGVWGYEKGLARQGFSLRCVGAPIEQQIGFVQRLHRSQNNVDVFRSVCSAVKLRSNRMLRPESVRLPHEVCGRRQFRRTSRRALAVMPCFDSCQKDRRQDQGKHDKCSTVHGSEWLNHGLRDSRC